MGVCILAVNFDCLQSVISTLQCVAKLSEGNESLNDKKVESWDLIEKTATTTKITHAYIDVFFKLFIEKCFVS